MKVMQIKMSCHLKKTIFSTSLTLALLQGCTFNSGGQVETVDYVDLPRFMGTWHVIASIPTFVEEGHQDAVEHYILREDGKIDIDYSYRKEDKAERDHIFQLGLPKSQTNAEWMVEFFWIFQSGYLVIELDTDYLYTVITVPNKKYLWIMAREKAIPPQQLKQIISGLKTKGFETSKIEMMTYGS